MDAAAARGSGFGCSTCGGEGRCAGFLAFAGAGCLLVKVGDGFGWGAEEGDLEFGRVEGQNGAELGRWEWCFLHAWFGGYEELLVLDGNVEGGLYLCREVLECR